MWIAIGVSIAVQIVGWIPTLDLLSGGGLNAIDGLVSANVLIKAGLLGSVPLVLAIIGRSARRRLRKALSHFPLSSLQFRSIAPE